MNKAKKVLKNYFRRSLYGRKKDDYKEIFTRGFENCDKANTVYPWFYLRVLLVLFSVFTVYAVCIGALGRLGMNRLMFFITGGAFLDIAFLVLLFELYPRRDFSLLKLFGVCIVGGTVANMLCALLYYIAGDAILNGWKLAAIAGIGEEIAKAVPAVACIIILKAKDKPAAGFLIGAAVGTWFSFTENASYIWSYSPAVYRGILTAVIRAFGCPFSHAAWTAIISWAFCKLKKPYINLKFYAAVLLCMALHFCIDMPLGEYFIILAAEASVCGLIAFFLFVRIIYKERKAALAGVEPCAEAWQPLNKTNLTAVGFGVALCALLLAFASVFGYAVKATYFNSEEDFLLYAHDGYNISADSEREYDEGFDNYRVVYEYSEQEGQMVLREAEQRVDDGEVTYCYFYRQHIPLIDDWGDDTEHTESEQPDDSEEQPGDSEQQQGMVLLGVDVIITRDGEQQRYSQDTYYYFGEVYSFYSINDELLNQSFTVDDGKIVLISATESLNVPTIVLLCLCCATALGGIITYTVMRKKHSD